MLTKNLITNFKPFIRCLPIMNLSYNTIKSITFIPEKKFSTDFESSSKQINIFKIIKSGENSIYDLPYGYDATNEFLEKEAEAGSTKEHFFTHSDIVQNVSSFLKELEIGKASSSRQSKFQDVKKSITLLHQEEIKNEFLKISTATEILEKNVNELRDSLADVLINIQSRNEGKYEENDLNKLTKNFLELGKYFLKNDLYSLEHNINIPSRISKDNLVKLAEAKKILEILNFSEIKDEQFLSMLPVFIMLNNLYVISENTMEELISEVSIRLFNPLGNSNLSQNNSEILKRYFVFLLLNSNFTKSTFDLDHLVIEKDTVLNFAKGGINDVLYILIDNIYKFAYANNETNATKPKTATLPKNVISFENFLRCYLKNVQVLIGKEDSVTKINYDLVENFLYSLLLLKESNYGNNILTSTVKDEIRHFINSGIFNLNLVKEVKVKNFLNPNDNLNRNLLKVDNDNISKKNLNDFCNRPNSLELLLEVENKIFSKLDEESDEFTFTFRESIFTAINSKNFLNQSNSDFKRYKDIIISSYFNYSEKKQNLVKSLSHKIISESFSVTLSISDTVYLLNSFCKYDVKEAKLFFDSVYQFLLSKVKQFTPENFVSLLYCISRYNLIDVYDMNPLYVEFLFNFETKKFRGEIRQNLPKILFLLSNFALRTKEFNPLFKEMTMLLPQYLKENLTMSEASYENLENILLSLAVVELSMKYNLTDVDFGRYFTPEILTSLLNLYVIKKKNDENLQIFVENFGLEKITYSNTNMIVFNYFNFKDDTIPLILVNNSDYNLDGKFVSAVYIKFYHLNSYLQDAPMILNVDRVKTKDDLSKEVSAYWRNQNGAYKKYLI